MNFFPATIKDLERIVRCIKNIRYRYCYSVFKKLVVHSTVYHVTIYFLISRYFVLVFIIPWQSFDSNMI